MRIIVFLIMFILFIGVAFASEEGEIFDSSVYMCYNKMPNEEYAELCIKDQMEQWKIFHSKYEIYLIEYGGSENKKNKAAMVLGCLLNYYYEKYDVANFGMVNVCCEIGFEWLERKE